MNEEAKRRAIMELARKQGQMIDPSIIDPDDLDQALLKLRGKQVEQMAPPSGAMPAMRQPSLDQAAEEAKQQEQMLAPSQQDPYAFQGLGRKLRDFMGKPSLEDQGIESDEEKRKRLEEEIDNPELRYRRRQGR